VTVHSIPSACDRNKGFGALSPQSPRRCERSLPPVIVHSIRMRLRNLVHCHRIHELVSHEAAAASSAMCFTRGRIRFQREDGPADSPPQGRDVFLFRQRCLDVTASVRQVRLRSAQPGREMEKKHRMRSSREKPPKARVA